ncbi:hypothetical protein A3J19_04290 [Candidatus Daviesbacteria bacterium RIFCSPLOWO2_02_FULL_41_8]|uniref:Capsule synthesis protein CapA domain-containing protein n=3 Tax=Candidatus Daviesiibacteriota TaxID=1752718 RepID=A0A1F5NJ72_9BACT|nr:MAG: hypothetical protein A2871_00410 [Candidatus Daviesbacteria bacterium RIFCSPHIGHO2_01_FULL_41_23]OGE32860.1 MAG: hypothetical protein A3D83_01705 [Candidatus Daviesbacteria bacterium RIFCSPHIGHO2_02_FULL_41_10]OGE77709.1 MAG: hypothetical protein A3J19_04290 [Candidatus Daviesbacteria bacterium RIFCSPLOWO2_02_FULL_41_8]
MIRKLAILFILLILFIFLQWKSPVKSRINTISDQTGAVSNPGFPTLDRIFNSEHKWKTALPAGRVRTIIATGDIIPARSVNFEVFRRQDFNWPYRLTYQVTQSADITFANLESPEIKKCPLTNEGMIFCGDYRNIEGLKFAGIDVVSLANNHAGNFGEEGIKETVGHLKNAGIESTGTALSNLVIKNIRGVRFAFLGFNDISKDQPGISNVDEEKIKTEIAEAKKLSEVVIVAMHWGAEYKDRPDDRQKYLGHLAVDSGADLVIGNHPHWIQPVEIYKDKLITYAHGNFVFDQEWSQKTKEGVIGKYIFFDTQLIDVEFLPVQIENFGQPGLLTGYKKKLILKNMKNAGLQ